MNLSTPNFEPESRESMAARFAQAIAPDIDVREVERDQRKTPGLLRRHVFDFEERIRMIASTDRQEKLRALHLSFSFDPERYPNATQEKLHELALAIAREFIGRKKPLASSQSRKAFHVFFKPFKPAAAPKRK
jgi:hypothetical protein